MYVYKYSLQTIFCFLLKLTSSGNFTHSQEKAKERKLTAEKLAEAEALLREQANEDDKSEEDEGVNDGDRSPASRANTLTDVDYRPLTPQWQYVSFLRD